MGVYWEFLLFREALELLLIVFIKGWALAKTGLKIKELKKNKSFILI